MSEKQYQSKKNNLGMYCAECDHSICVECLDSSNSVSDINDITLGKMISIIEKGKFELPESLRKYIIMKCPNCGAFFGDFLSWKAEKVTNLLSKAEKGEDLSLDEIGEVVMILQVFTVRLIKCNLIKGRVDDLRNALESIIKGFALPKGQIEIQKSLKEQRLNDTRKICNRLVLWGSLLKNNQEYTESLKTLLSQIGQLQSSIITIPENTSREPIEKVGNIKVDTGRSVDKIPDEISVESTKELIAGKKHRETALTKEQLRDLGLAMVRGDILSSNMGILGAVIKNIREKDDEKYFDELDIMSSLKDEDAKIPAIAAKMLVDDDDEFSLTAYGISIIAQLRALKVKEGAVVFHAFSAKGNVKGQEDFINKILSYKLFKFSAGNEGKLGLEQDKLNRTVVIYTDENEIDGNVGGVEYVRVKGDFNKINALKLFTTIIQKGSLNSDDQKVLANIEEGNYDLVPTEFKLTHDEHYRLLVVIAMIRKAMYLV
jgi:hypothetical protein